MILKACPALSGYPYLAELLGGTLELWLEEYTGSWEATYVSGSEKMHLTCENVVIDHIEGRLWDIFRSQVPEEIHEEMGDSDDFTMAHLYRAHSHFPGTRKYSITRGDKACLAL